jgi:phosphoribosyl 1,2-cyclic phosphate phosphodiesterase
MKSKLIILGCGSSVGVPRIDGFWGKCNRNEKKNIRTRCSAIIIKGNNIVLIDVSPDIKAQLLKNKIKKITSVLFTHEHADQTHGINELRPFYWINGKKINIYSSSRTINYLMKTFSYCFKKKYHYEPIFNPNVINGSFVLGRKEEKIKFETITVNHGKIKSLGYIFEKVAYISDCKEISQNELHKLKDLNYFIVDCLKFKKHPTHFNLSEVLSLVYKLKPKKTILTNLHSDIDYKYLLNILPRDVKPAYDGLKLIF